CARFDSFAYW
nr:immunoglobulin heavy chain junction region [Mus musculus]